MFFETLLTQVRARCVVSCALFCLVSAVFCGCGSEEGPTYASVKGKVSLDGKPVQSGTVLYVPQGDTEGGVSSGEIGKDGTYELVGPRGKGVVVGTHRVLVQCPQEGSGPDTGENPLENVPPCTVPQKYALESTSDITKQVTESENEIDVELFSGR